MIEQKKTKKWQKRLGTLAILATIFGAGWPAYVHFCSKEDNFPEDKKSYRQIGIDIRGSNVNVGGDWVVNNQQTISSSLPPEQIELLVNAVEGAVSLHDNQSLMELAKELGIHENAVKSMLSTLGEKEVPLEQLHVKLNEIASRYKDTLVQLQALQSSDPKVQRLRKKAQRALDDGDYKQADILLVKAFEADEKALKTQQAALEERQISAAATLAVRAEVAASRLDYRKAAALYAKAANILPDMAERSRWEYFFKQAGMLLNYGDEFGDNPALGEAIVIYQDLLHLRSRAVFPLDWAMTQNNLGNALQTLGEREPGTKRLQEAVNAYRAALEEHTRERVPLHWAMTQYNLAGVYLQLAATGNQLYNLEEAHNCCSNAVAGFSQCGAKRKLEMAGIRLKKVQARLEAPANQ